MEQSFALSVLVPVYNEEENVVNLFNELIDALGSREFQFEIIFIDDGSQDATCLRIDELIATEPRVKLIRHRRNFGQSAALITGAKKAIYPYLVTLDGDGQNDPADIPSLCRLLKDDKTIILGNRKKRNDSFLRRFSSKMANYSRQLLLRDHCPDTGCSLKIFPRDAFLRLPHFNHLHRYLPALFMREGYQLINVPVNHRPRLHGQSKYGVRNRLFVGIYDLFGVRWLLKRPCAPEIINEN